MFKFDLEKFQIDFAICKSETFFLRKIELICILNKNNDQQHRNAEICF